MKSKVVTNKKPVPLREREDEISLLMQTGRGKSRLGMADTAVTVLSKFFKEIL